VYITNQSVIPNQHQFIFDPRLREVDPGIH